METLTIKSPADILSFIGHTLCFWPHESLACITLDENQVGATLRVDFPMRDGGELAYARTVARYLTSDANATSVLFAVYTSTPWESSQTKPHAATIAALTGALAERYLPICDGLLVGDHAFSQYDGDPTSSPAIPLTTTESSEINAEFIYRGSIIEPTGRITLPPSTKEATTDHAIEGRMEKIRRLRNHDAIDRARKLWAGMLEAKTYPTDDQVLSLIAIFQFIANRDQLMADIPGVNEPVDRVLLAQTPGKPVWSGIEWAQQLLLHAYTRTSTQHAAAVLTAIGYINSWEGRGSKAHQFMQLAREADPGMIGGGGMIAGWNMDEDRAFRAWGLET